MAIQSKLSATGKMTVALSLAFIGQVAVASGTNVNIESVAGGAQVFKQNQVDVVNIVKANEQGLSHNQFNKFNVAKEGAVLNNALAAGQSQLAGHLAANENLQGKAASVILNEVVSKNPSLILGQQEIFGMAADYVLANPNGITYNGGSILNASRASLVVGRPDIQGGSLKAFTVGENGEQKELRVNGVMSGNDVVDLVAPKVVVSKSANLNAGKINMVSGANKVGYTDDTIEKLEQAQNAPVLDGQVFGAMRAGSIRIHGTDSRATQTFDGANIQADNELNVQAAGNLQVRAAQLSGTDVTLAAQNTVVDGVKERTTDNYSFNTTEAKNVKAAKFGNTLTETYAGSSITAKGALNLQNTGDITLTGATVEAGSLNASAQNFATDTQTTVETVDHNYNRSKGLWFNNTQTTSSDATVHNTKINVKGGAVIDASQNVSLKAAVLNVGGDAKLTGQTGIQTSGVTETDTSSETVNFKNETAALKTGSSSQAQTTQKQIGTQINVGGDLGLVTGKTLNTQATSVKTGGSVVTTAEKVNLGTQKTANSSDVNDKLKYWGGIGGGKDGQASSRTETLHGTSIVADGSVLLGATDAVVVSGGTVKGKTGAFVNAAQVDVKHATTTDIQSNSNRTGTVFNITKSRTQSSTTTQNVNGTVLESDADLTVVAQNDINVIGSSVKAAQKLGMESAGNLNIAAAQAKQVTHEQTFSINGKTNASASLASGSASAGVGLVFTNTTTDTDSTLNTGSSVSGSEVELTAKQDVNVVGSQVTADNNVSVKGENVSVTAADDTTVTNEKTRVTDVGITGTVSYNGGAPKVGVSAGVSSKFADTTTTNTTAQVSGITAGGNVDVTANNNITHEGTQIDAQGDVNQTAKNITNEAAQNSSNVSTVQHQGGIGIGASIDTAKKVTVEGNIYGQGGKAETTSTTAVVGSVNANNVNLTAENNITDVATNYVATGDVNINAENYDNQAAKNTQSVDSKQGGASIGLAVSTSDGQTFDVDAKVGVNYADEHGKSSQAVKGNIAANNVNINAADTAAVASDIQATENVTIDAANGVTFTQSQDTAESNGTKVDVGLGIGAKVHVSGAVAPKGSVSVGVNVGDKESTTGSAGTITAGNDIIATAENGTVHVDGANLVADNLVKLEGKVVESNGLTDTRKENGVNVGVSLGASSTLTETTTTQTTTTNEQHWVQDTYCEPPKLVLTQSTETTQSTEIGTQMTGATIGLNVGVKKENEVSNTANVIIGKGGMTTTPDQIVKEPDTIIKEPDTVVTEPDTVQVIPAVIVPIFDDNNTVIGEEVISTEQTVTIPGKTITIPGKETIIPGKETVIPGKTEQTGGVIINANSAGNGVSIKGTNIEAGVVSITNEGGNVHIGSLEGSLNKTNASAGIGLSLDVNGDQVKPNGGSAEVTVDLAKNKTFTGSSITATGTVSTPDQVVTTPPTTQVIPAVTETIYIQDDNGTVVGQDIVIVEPEKTITIPGTTTVIPGKTEQTGGVIINAKDNLDLISSTITAPNVSGSVGGSLNIEAQQNVVDETYVHVGVGVGVKPSGIKPTKEESVDYIVMEDGTICYPEHKEITTVTTVESKELGSKVQNPQTADNNALIAAGGTVLQGAQTVQGAVGIADSLKKGEKVERDDIANVMTGAIDTVTTAAQNKGKVSETLGSISSDIASGSIAGVSAHLNVAVDVEKSKTTNKTGIFAENLNLDVADTVSNKAGQVVYQDGTGFGDAKVVDAGSNVDYSKKIEGHLNLTTDIAQNIANGIEMAQTGNNPWVGGSIAKTEPTTVLGSISQETVAPTTPVVETPTAVTVEQPTSVVVEQPATTTPAVETPASTSVAVDTTVTAPVVDDAETEVEDEA